jgi:hypothetical protein
MREVSQLCTSPAWNTCDAEVAEERKKKVHGTSDRLAALVAFTHYRRKNINPFPNHVTLTNLFYLSDLCTK